MKLNRGLLYFFCVVYALDDLLKEKYVDYYWCYEESD